MSVTTKRLAKTGSAYKAFAAKACTQLGNSVENNADLQAALLTNSSRDDKPDSRISNPAKAHPNEKWEMAEQIRDKLKKQVNAASHHLKIDAPITMAQATAQGMPFLDTLTTLPAMIGDLAVTICKLGMVKANGWKMDRLADGYSLMAKFKSVVAETVISHEAPVISENAEIKHVTAEVLLETVSTKKVICKDEIHRVAMAYGVDAASLALMAATFAKIRANLQIELAATGTVDISGVAGVTTKTGGELKQSAGTHTIVDALGGTIRVVGGVVMINPLIRAIPEIPTVVPPIVPHVPLTPTNGVDVVPQYMGVNGLGTSVLS